MRFLFVVALIGLAGCGYSIPKRQAISRMNSISLGQPRQEVVNVLGEPERMVFQKDGEQGRIRADRYFLWKGWVPIYNLVACPFLLTVTCWAPLKGTSGEYYFLTYLNDKLVEIENREPQLSAVSFPIIQPIQQQPYPQKSIYMQPAPGVIIQTNK